MIQRLRSATGPLIVVLALVFSFVPSSASAQSPTRAIVLGWDGTVPAFALEMVRQGKLPNLAKLIEGGAYADDVKAVFPSKTAPGFAALITGAPPRVSGISGNRVPRAPREQFTILESLAGFSSAPLRAETDLGRRAPGGQKVGGCARSDLCRRARRGNCALLGLYSDRRPRRHRRKSSSQTSADERLAECAAERCPADRNRFHRRRIADFRPARSTIPPTPSSATTRLFLADRARRRPDQSATQSRCRPGPAANFSGVSRLRSRRGNRTVRILLPPLRSQTRRQRFFSLLHPADA